MLLLHFIRDATTWRCVEYPDLVMPQGGGYEVDGQGFNSLAEALAILRARLLAVLGTEAREVP